MKKILSAFLICILVVGMTGCSSSSDDSDSSSSSSSKKTEYKVNETAKIDKVEYTITNVSTSQGNEFLKPEDGKEWVVCHVKIVNNSDDKIDYNALYFKMVNSNGQEDTITLSYTEDGTLDSGDLNAGGNVEGDLAFEEPTGDASLKLKLYSDILYDSPTATFIIR